MIALLIRLLLAYQAGTICQIGQPVDFYDWFDAHRRARPIAGVDFDNEMAWIYQDDNSEDTVMVFVFDSTRKPVWPNPDWHGECFMRVELDEP